MSTYKTDLVLIGNTESCETAARKLTAALPEWHISIVSPEDPTEPASDTDVGGFQSNVRIFSCLQPGRLIFEKGRVGGVECRLTDTPTAKERWGGGRPIVLNASRGVLVVKEGQGVGTALEILKQDNGMHQVHLDEEGYVKGLIQVMLDAQASDVRVTLGGKEVRVLRLEEATRVLREGMR